MKVTLKTEHLDGTAIEVTHPHVETLTEALELMESLLKAAGFVFNGNLDIVEEPKALEESEETDARYICRMDNEASFVERQINEKLTSQDDPAGMSYTGGSDL